ncbi:MAG: hypothetical protein ACTSSH_06050 [Candidatus Heimdallarchaeota archaeon]
MAWYDFIFSFIPGISERWNAIVFACITWGALVLIISVIWIVTATRKKKKGIDVSALTTLASSDPMAADSASNANPQEVMAILSIERVAASTALSAVKDARKSKRISSSVADSLNHRYKARITKIDTDLKRRSGAQEYQSLADSLEQSRDRIRGEVMPSSSTRAPPPPPSPTPGIPASAPPVPGRTLPPAPPSSGPPSATSSAIPSIPKLPSSGPPSMGTPPSKPSSPIPTPPKIPAVGPPTARPTTVIPPSVAPPTISTPPLPPRVPTASSIAPPTTSDLVPPAVPTSSPVASAPVVAAAEGDSQSISGLRMEMLRELARLKKFMSEETQ